MSSDLLGLDKRFGMRFGEISLELGVTRHLLKSRSGKRMSEKGFGEEDNQLLSVVSNCSIDGFTDKKTYGFSEVSLILSPENVEIVGRGSGVDDLHIAVLVLPLQLFR